MRTGEDAESERAAAWLRAQVPEVQDFARRLAIANSFAMWKDCPRDACRRVRLCRGDDVACFDERRGELTRLILQYVVMLLVTADISSEAFYDYLDAASEAGDEETPA